MKIHGNEIRTPQRAGTLLYQLSMLTLDPRLADFSFTLASYEIRRAVSGRLISLLRRSARNFTRFHSDRFRIVLPVYCQFYIFSCHSVRESPVHAGHNLSHNELSHEPAEGSVILGFSFP